MTTEIILQPPIAKTVPHQLEHLGRPLSDPYAWLQNKHDPEVIAYLEAENTYTKAHLKPTEPLQERLYQEMLGRIQEDDSTVPEQRGEYFYYWRTEAGQQYRLFCRRHTAPDAPEEVLVDENQLAEGHSYCRVYIAEPSPDNTLLAYAVDLTGAWVFNLVVLDMQTRQIVNAPIPNTAWSVAWASDSRTLFYTVFDDAHRAYQLLRHTVGAADDVLLYQEDDAAFIVGVQRSRSGAYVLMTLESMSTTEVHYLRSDMPTADFTVLHPRQAWVEYYVEHHGDRFYIWTNEDAVNFKLMTAPVTSPDKAHWQTAIAHREDVLLSHVEAFQDFIVLIERRSGLPQIGIAQPDALNAPYYVAFPEPVYSFRMAANPEFDTTALRLFYSSLITPESTVDYQVADGAWQVRKVQTIPSGHDPARYTTERVYATAPDGTAVPMSLVYRKDVVRNGCNPLLLYGYGSYGVTVEAQFDPNRFSLIDRGVIFAIAHVRGGSELGRRWYEQGRLMHKMNSFTDFIACAEALIVGGYTTSQQLAIMGGSAGGLLVSAAANLRPDLFKVVLAMVPFTNVITAILDPDLPLTVTEYEQWGNPSDPSAFDYMRSYSPYDNIVEKAYPHIYAKGGLNDLQVPYWDPAKWVAKLRATKTDDHVVCLYTNMGAGHGGASGRYERLREIAEYYAFMLDKLGIEA